MEAPRCPASIFNVTCAMEEAIHIPQNATETSLLKKVLSFIS